MIRNIILFGTLVFTLFSSCKKQSEDPACIVNKVDEFKFTISCNVGGNVKEYEFQSKPVFVFDPGTCGADMTSEVLDENCNSLGFLGGIAGNTKINGEDFNNAKLKRTVWSK
jgi:hypothetical protein